MKKTLSSLLVVLTFISSGLAQKPDIEKIKTTYRQFPDKPLADSVKTYSIQLVNQSKTAITVPGPTINNQLQLEGFQYDQNKPDVLITIVINDIPVEFGTYARTRGANGVPAQFVYTATARLVGTISFNTPDNKYEFYSVSQLDKPEDLSVVAESQANYATENDAKQAQNNDKGLQDRVTREFFNTVFKNIATYLNNHHGYPAKTEYLPVWGIKSKDGTYQDFDQAVVAYQAASALISQPEKKDELKAKLTEALTIWEKAVSEYNPSDKDARISSKNILETYANLTLANIWLQNFAEAKRYYALAEKEKGISQWKPIIQNLLLSQESGLSQDQLRTSGKIRIEKKLSDLYVSPEFIPFSSKVRIKYILTYTEDHKGIHSRMVFEYDEKGFLTKIYEQNYKPGSREFYGMSGVQTVKYNHHDNTITIPNVKKDLPSSIYTVKKGQVVKRVGPEKFQEDHSKYTDEYKYYDNGWIKQVIRKGEGRSQGTWKFNLEKGRTKSIISNHWSVPITDTTFSNYKFEFMLQSGVPKSFTNYFGSANRNDLSKTAATYECLANANGLVTRIATEHQLDTYAYDADNNLIESARHGGGKRYTYEWEKGPGHPNYYFLTPDDYRTLPGLYPGLFKIDP